ncbi:hypothetical protein [uncultured Sphingomonas sp.]|uniref:hypothetical protein n=1 Tax=uncultured Sphingomonas sp. TaxID=158754 RepID=UPI0025CC5091|nr:hypothetical protein [uncultured Sphingomonas sp.]
MLIQLDGLSSVDLVASFAGAGPAAPHPGELVAGVQQVLTQAYIDYNQQLPLWWMAQVLRIGDISASGSVATYTADTDSFTLRMGEIVLNHGSAGWSIPSFDSTVYSVFVGFGLGSPYAFPAFLAQVSPLTTVQIGAGGYVLGQPSNSGTIGSPVAASDSWTMPLGEAWLLCFNASGVGTLSSR